MSLKNHLAIFKSTLLISAFTFGGGYVIVPMMKKKFVDEYDFLNEEEMLDIAAIAQSAPGAMAVNAAILIGWRLLGFSGAFVAIIGTVLPPLLILSIISIFYANIRANPIAYAILKGMMAGVCAIIIDVVISMGGKILKARKVIPMIIMIGAFVTSFIFKVNVVYIILICALLGAFLSLYSNSTEKDLY